MQSTVNESVEQFIALEQQKTLLRILTCGSVDDGKSTLIGRLLHDTRNVYEDQLQSIAKGTLNRSTAAVDLSLLTDGLRAEREQGITIDVAYRYFTTARRKFVLADTPGHEQFTRNMATGASTADVAIILIDARHGVLPQSRRHAYICSLLGIRTAVVAINKMDLLGFDQKVFDAIRAEFAPLLEQLHYDNPYFLPCSALDGDNIVDRSKRIPWFEGPALLEYLENTDPNDRAAQGDFRFSVQHVIRPNLDFRGYAGTIASGVIRTGDDIRVWPSRRTSKISRIVTYDGDLEAAQAGQSVTLTLEDEIDIARGELFTRSHEAPTTAKRFYADIVWMQDRPLRLDRPWIIKHTTRQVRTRAVRIRHRVNINTFEEQHNIQQLGLNEIGVVEFEGALPLFFDPYTSNRTTGAFIIIDPETNATAGAGMLRGAVEAEFRPVKPGDRVARYGHQSKVIRLNGRTDLARRLERRIFDRGGVAAVLDHANIEVLEALAEAGCIALLVNEPSTAPLAVEDHAAIEELLDEIFGSHSEDGKAGEVATEGEGI
ncbi:sulfate adenylyltransferase subunit 1 [Bryobacterales bacterium F-183]|nr:sulfate adenylyltransferase subunit 1 [Bryobacterales bacterium F-183]